MQQTLNENGLFDSETRDLCTPLVATEEEKRKWVKAQEICYTFSDESTANQTSFLEIA